MKLKDTHEEKRIQKLIILSQPELTDEMLLAVIKKFDKKYGTEHAKERFGARFEEIDRR